MIEKRSLRIFGILWSVIFFFLGYKNGLNIFFIISISFLLSSILFPEIYLKSYLYQGWIKFGDLIGNINSKIIIFIMFFFILTPIGLFLKGTGKHFLSKRIEKKRISYLEDREFQPGSMINQF
tara:strand:- start:110 stop:478 length:369 start_codon:yes stop_codon:yes gene_type:complete